jgi:hypothetical protein
MLTVDSMSVVLGPTLSACEQVFLYGDNQGNLILMMSGGGYQLPSYRDQPTPIKKRNA